VFVGRFASGLVAPLSPRGRCRVDGTCERSQESTLPAQGQQDQSPPPSADTDRTGSRAAHFYRSPSCPIMSPASAGPGTGSPFVWRASSSYLNAAVLAARSRTAHPLGRAEGPAMSGFSGCTAASSVTPPGPGGAVDRRRGYGRVPVEKDKGPEAERVSFRRQSHPLCREPMRAAPGPCRWHRGAAEAAGSRLHHPLVSLRGGARPSAPDSGPAFLPARRRRASSAPTLAPVRSSCGPPAGPPAWRSR